MTHRLLRPLAAATTAAIAVTLMGVAPAGARPVDVKPEPSARGFGGSIKVKVAPGGTANVTSGDLNKTTKSVKVEVGAPLSDQPGFKTMAFMLLQLPTPGQRLVACITMTSKDITETADFSKGKLNEAEVKGFAPTQALATLYFCLRLSQLVAEVLAGSGRWALAAPKCGAAPLGVKTKTEKQGSNYLITPAGDTTKKRKNSKLKVKCTKVGTKMVFDIRPRKKNKSLRSVVGKNLTLGIASPPSAEDGAKVKVTFKAP